MDFLSTTVLVVDDDERARSHFRDIIESDLKARYREAADPRVVIDMIKKIAPALIILDTHLPYIDGLSLLNMIRSAPETKDIPVMATSDNADETLVHLMVERGIADFIVKPFNRDNVRQRIVSVLQNAQKQSQS